MKKVLIASFDMEVGGVERSLISMLENFDYVNFNVDLMLYRHQGDFMHLIPKAVNLLGEISKYTTFRKSVTEILKEKQYLISFSRIVSKLLANFIGEKSNISESGYLQMQLMWKYALPFLPKMSKSYDIAISYLWPHYFVAEKVRAKKKIAWIHTDYSKIETNITMDLNMWKKFDYIIAVSDACKTSFLTKYSELKSKIVVMENITSPEFIRLMAKEEIDNPMKNDNRFKIVTVARLSHAKGIDNAIKALKILKNQGYQNIAWYVVGYGGDESMLKELIIENSLENCFYLLGKQINPYPFIKECDLYVQPSRYEGKAVTVTEAKILGKPILITNYSTAKSQVDHGKDGVICELDVEDIANGIERLINDNKIRKYLSENCSCMEYKNSDELEKLYKLI
jgi:glycosyltransferase involved in cell wall biosynthesis